MLALLALALLMQEPAFDWSETELHEAMPVSSPDVEFVAMAEDELVHFVSADTGAETEAAHETPAPIRSPAFHPGGQLLATGHGDNCLRVWDLRARGLVFEHYFGRMLDAHLHVHVVAFSPDGRFVAGVAGNTARSRSSTRKRAGSSPRLVRARVSTTSPMNSAGVTTRSGCGSRTCSAKSR